MQNIIVNKPCRVLRARGRVALRGNWNPAIIAMLVYVFLSQLVPTCLNALGLEAVTGIYTILIAGALTFGISSFFLKLTRKETVTGIEVLQAGTSKFLKALGLMLFQGLFILLWTLLFIVPGFIAALRYSQAFYIMADDPNKGIRQCMNESKALMKGNKGKLFKLLLTFIGWMCLFGLAVSIISTAVSYFLYAKIAMIIISFIFSVLYAPLGAYVYATNASFYGELTKENK